MKAFVAILLMTVGSVASAFEYKCKTQDCTLDGCTSYTYYLLIEKGTIQYWMELGDKKKVDYTDIRNVKKDSIRVGELDSSPQENGNTMAKGDGLVAKDDREIPNFLYRENEVDASLVNGHKHGSMLEITHIHYANSPANENKPSLADYKCSLLE